MSSRGRADAPAGRPDRRRLCRAPLLRPRPTDARLPCVRVDVWLDVACLFRTRSEAQRAVKGGKVEINGGRAKPHREVRAGDEIRITRTHGVTQVVTIVAVAERHVPKADARTLYSGSDAAADAGGSSAQDAGSGAAAPAAPTPNKRQRRQLQRLKGRA